MQNAEAPRYHTLEEILSQPAAWQDALDELARKREAMAVFSGQAFDHLLFVGCGSPYFLARTAAQIAHSVVRKTADAQTASDVWLFPDQTLLNWQSPLMVVISRSGETSEIMHAVDRFRETYGERGRVAAITCYPNSTLAKAADFALFCEAAQEIGLAQTRSFTSMLLLTVGLIHALAGATAGADATGTGRLPEYCQQLLDEHGDFARQFGSRDAANLHRFFFLGSGAQYGLACEAMLKMKEMSLSASEAYHFLEFRHGPMSMVDDRSLVVGLISERASDYEAAVLGEMRRRGATVLALTPVALPEGSADHTIRLPDGLSDVTRGVLYLPLLHLIIYSYTVQKGLNPDTLHNVAPVVHLDGVSMRAAQPV